MRMAEHAESKRQRGGNVNDNGIEETNSQMWADLDGCPMHKRRLKAKLHKVSIANTRGRWPSVSYQLDNANAETWPTLHAIPAEVVRQIASGSDDAWPRRVLRLNVSTR